MEYCKECGKPLDSEDDHVVGLCAEHLPDPEQEQTEELNFED